MDTYRELLTEFISFKSISTDSKFIDGINKTVAWLEQLFTNAGAQVEVVRGYDNPIVLATFAVEDGPHCLVYGHYDVQPADIADGWEQDPFSVRETDERLYARGAVDNKGQVLVHIASVLDAVKNGTLTKSVTFFLEGNEETGSPNMDTFIKDNAEKLNADFALISDGEITGETPVIEAGFRGGFNATVSVTTSSTDLHSGIYGGAVPSASHELMLLLSDLIDNEYQVQIPGFYDDVDEVTKQQKEMNSKIPFSEEEYKAVAGVKKLLSNDVYTDTALMPSVQISGIQSGYTGTGYRNSVPGTALAKINFRLVKSQNSEDIAARFKQWVIDHVPDYVDVVVDINDPYEGIKLDLDSEYIREAEDHLAKVYNTKPVHKYSGGGLPIVTLLQEQLGITPVLVPLGNEDCNMHAIEENINKKHLEYALTFSQRFFTH